MTQANSTVSLQPLGRELSIQEAADLLNVSQPFLVKLLAQEAIPHTMVDSHPLIRFEDLVAYKEQRDFQRRQSLRKLTQLSEEMGLYDNDNFD